MEILSTFGINFKMLIASIINFAILLYLLNKIMYQPLLKVLEDRKAKIDESLANADTIEKKLKETETREKEMLHKARIESDSIIKKAEEMAVIRQKQILDSAAEQANKIIERGEAKIEQRRAELEKDLKQNTVSLVIETTRLILKDNMPKNIDEDYIKEALKAKTDNK
jgi:F-type H+-transporting ATPase subunit b